jgi:hypothetical protein
MALGEWLSVQSSRELNQRQIGNRRIGSLKKREKRTGFIVSSQRNECGRKKIGR